MIDEFVGAGWAFPLRTDPTGRIALVRHHREIEESIRIILGTSIGERPMRPEFGCEIHDYVLGPLTPDVMARMARAVRAALVRWEPRVEVERVDVKPSDEASAAYIDIWYTIKPANDPRNLVFPFYAIGSES